VSVRDYIISLLYRNYPQKYVSHSWRVLFS